MCVFREVLESARACGDQYSLSALDVSGRKARPMLCVH